jgi:hypothetical protein
VACQANPKKRSSGELIIGRGNPKSLLLSMQILHPRNLQNNLEVAG